MREDVFAEFILLKNNQSDSRREHDVLFRWVDEQVPIASADAAIAVVHVA
jgi:hypothetical protein